MIKKILLTICCVFSVLLSYAQGAEQSIMVTMAKHAILCK